MNVFLTHIDWSPVLYGIALFLSVMSMAWKLKRQQYAGFIVEILVVAVILIVHGGSVTGGFAATIAGLLSGWCLPLIFRNSPAKSSVPSTNTEPQQPPVFSAYDIYLLSRKH